MTKRKDYAIFQVPGISVLGKPERLAVMGYLADEWGYLLHDHMDPEGESLYYLDDAENLIVFPLYELDLATTNQLAKDLHGFHDPPDLFGHTWCIMRSNDIDQVAGETKALPLAPCRNPTCGHRGLDFNPHGTEFDQDVVACCCNQDAAIIGRRMVVVKSTRAVLDHLRAHGMRTAGNLRLVARPDEIHPLRVQ